jgi:CubicO group peptidase (beta-lactamase class C family)
MKSGNFPDALQAKVDAALDRSLQEQRIVGAVLLIAHQGERIYERAVGMADRESQQAMQLDSLFRFSSVTKPLVTAAAMALIARGKLSLSDATHEWLPTFRPRLSNGQEATITIRELMTHTSGLGYVYQEPIDGPYHRANVSDGLDQPGLEFEEALDRLASCPLLSVPGTAFRYSLS